VFLAVLKETASPRAKGILNNHGITDKLFYLCTLCDNHVLGCPVNAELEILEARSRLVRKGTELPQTKRLIENIRKYGNPFGPEQQAKI